MANVLSKGSLFPAKLTNELFNQVKGKSALAALSASEPMPFNGKELFTFNLDKEVDVLAENGAKSNGGATMGTFTMTPVKIEYGARVSQEFMYATDEVQLQYLRAFAEGFARKAARGLDIMAFHGFNPRTKAASSVIGNNHFDYAVSNTVTMTDDGDEDVENAIALITAAEEDVSGIAMSPAFRSVLAAQTKQDGSKLFPELAWGAVPGALHGLPVQVNSTVNFDNSTPVHNDRAIIGNFADYFRWGYAKEIPLKVIEYGNPDNDADAGDLQGHNQIYLRAEAFIGWGILNPAAFARIVYNAG